MIPIITAAISAFPAISAAVSAIGPSVVPFCTTVLPKIAPHLHLDTGLKIIKIITTIATELGKLFNILQPQEDLQEMGDRALQAAGKNIKPENFSSHAEYMDELRSFKLDPVSSEKNNDTLKTMAGLAVISKGIEEKFNYSEGSVSNLILQATLMPDYLTSTKLVQFIKGNLNITDIVQFFEGDLSPVDSRNIKNKMIEAEKQITPDKSETEIRDQISDAYQKFQKSN